MNVASKLNTDLILRKEKKIDVSAVHCHVQFYCMGVVAVRSPPVTK